MEKTEFDFDNTPVCSKRAGFDYLLKDLYSKPQISIVTPYYNTGKLFLQTVHSILSQSFTQWEWIIVNDGSDDEESLKVLDLFRNKDPRIKVVDLPFNQGLSAARNRGFSLSNSKFVLQIDSDDLLEATALEKLFWFLYTNKNFSFVSSYTVGFGAKKYLWNNGFEQKELFLEANQITPTALIRKEFWEKCKYNQSRKNGLEDWEFWLTCAEKGYWGGDVKEYLEWYRRRQDHSKQWNDWTKKGEEKFLKQMREKFPKLFKKRYFPNPKRDKKTEISFDYPKINLLTKKKKRVLMLIPWLEMGGADKFNLNFISQITQRGWEVTIVTTHFAKNRWLSEFLSYTPDIFFLHTFLNKYDYPRFLLYLINSRNFDTVMISNSELGYKLLPFLKAFYPQISYVDYNHMEQEEWNEGGYPKQGVEYQKFLDLNGVTSDHLKKWMISKGAKKEKIRRCYINVDTKIWKPDIKIKKEFKKELGIDEKVPLIFYAARICPQKKPFVFIKTIKELKKRGLNFFAVVAGGGEDFKQLKNFVYDYNLEDVVKLLGIIPNQEVNKIMKAADIFFLPSQWEGIALTIYEAMSSGVAIVGNNVGGQKELVSKDCGFLIEPSDDANEIKEYVKKIEYLIKNPDILIKTGKNARLRAKNYFKLKQMGECMQNFLEYALLLHKKDKGVSFSIEEAQILVKNVIDKINISEKRNFNLKVEIKNIINSNRFSRKLFEILKPYLKKLRG